MKMFAGLLLCILYVPYVSMEMSTAVLSEPSFEFVETFEKRCPPGLWCGKKRGIPEEQAMVPDDKDQHVKVDAGKKRDVSEEDMMKTFEKRCPPGLWCGKKRQAFGPNENKATEVAEANKTAEQFEKRCPPTGLWCGKRELSNEKSINTGQTEVDHDHSFMKAFEKRCPPGLWCGKKRETPEVNKEKSDDSLMKEDLKKFSSIKSKAEGTTEQGPLMDVFEKRCPPGLWCGKKRAITEEEEKE